MEDNNALVDLLLDKAKDYGKTAIQLAKLKALDKTSDFVSTWAPRTITLVLLLLGLIFASIGAADFLGECLGKSYYGFFVVAGFYGLVGIIMQVFLYNWCKTKISNKMIATVLQ